MKSTLKWFRSLLLIAALLAPLIISAASYGESGCHRQGGNGSSGNRTGAPG